MSWGGSPSCGFDLVNSDGSEYIPEGKKATKRERLLNWFELFYEEAKLNSKESDMRRPEAKKAYKEIKQLIKKSGKR